MKLLLVDSDKEALDRLTAYLRTEGFAVETAQDMETARIDVNIHDYSCIIAELTPKGGNVLELIKELKTQRSCTGIIVASSSADVSVKVAVLEAGADDFIPKPYEPAELKARVNSLIRRRFFNGYDELEYGCLKICANTHKVYVNDKKVRLTRKEYDLLVYLVTNRQRLLSHEMIAEHLWGDYMGVTADSFYLIYTHIKNIRKKLSQCGCPDVIETVYGAGYRIAQ